MAKIDKFIDFLKTFKKADDPAKAYRPGYVYKTVNTVDGMKYIGSRIGPKGHKGTYFDENYYGSGVDLKAAIDKYGIDKFINVKQLDTRTFNGMKNAEEGLLGLVDAAGRGDYYNNINKYKVGKGALPSDVTKERHRQSMVGKNKGPKSQEHKDKISKTHKGKVVSEETKMKLRKSATGRKMSEESKRKMSESRKGWEFSEESKRKMSESGKARTDNRGRGKVVSEETRKRQSEAAKARTDKRYNTGKNMSEEQKEKIRDAAKLQWKRQKGLL